MEIGRLQRHAVDAVMATRAHRCSPARSPAGAWRWSAPGRPVWPARTAWRATATTWCCSTPVPSRRPQRIRPGRLQDGRRLRAARDRLAAGDRRHHGAHRPRLGRDHARRRCAATSTRCSSAWAWPAQRVGVAGEVAGVRDAVDFIAELRQSRRPTLPIGRRVVVIGGGMTAVDAAVQSSLLGAERCTSSTGAARGDVGLAGRAGWAQTNGVTIHHWLAPGSARRATASQRGVRFARQRSMAAGCRTGELSLTPTWCSRPSAKSSTAPCWQLGLTLKAGRIATDDDGRTGLPASGPVATAAPAGGT